MLISMRGLSFPMIAISVAAGSCTIEETTPPGPLGTVSGQRQPCGPFPIQPTFSVTYRLRDGLTVAELSLDAFDGILAVEDAMTTWADCMTGRVD